MWPSEKKVGQPCGRPIFLPRTIRAGVKGPVGYAEGHIQMYIKAAFTRGRPNIWSAIYWSVKQQAKKGRLGIAFTRGRTVNFMTCAVC